MYPRYWASAPLGIAVTLSLLYVMQVLIEIGAGPMIPPQESFRATSFLRKLTKMWQR